jgi:uncharacterized protein YciI
MTHQFIYQLKLLPELLLEENWTERENQIVNEHFQMLESLCDSGKVILAGRTLNMNETGFGLVILEVDSEEEAQYIMSSDPAVKHGIMTATMFPYRIALLNQSKR